MKRICFASNNQNKLEEVRLTLGPDFHILSLDQIGCIDDLPETAETLQGNAHQKANFVFQKFGVACFADDTGLEVSALNNAPGVYSARYAGLQRNNEDNISQLLKNLQDKPDRKAQFRTVICWVDNGTVEYFEGIVKGAIINKRRGDKGFGYDSVFVPEGYAQTFAEMTMAEKNRLSHRAIAVRKLTEFLKGVVQE